MKQTSRIISTYSADTMGVCSALFELGGMTIMHDASGCNSTYTTHDEPRWYSMDSMVYISALTEMEAIMGDDEKLLGDIEDAVRELHPKFVAIAGTPIPTMTGFDFEAVAAVAEQRTGVPCMGFATTGMNTYIHGASLAFEALAKRFVKDPAEICEDDAPKEEDNVATGVPLNKKLKVNILGLTPLDFSVNGQDASIAKWLESENFEIVSRWAMGSTLDEIAMAGVADVNLVVSASGLRAARVLFERFGTPYAVGLPIGDELSGLLADQIKINAPKFKKEELLSRENQEGLPYSDKSDNVKDINKEENAKAPSFNTREISVSSGIFLGSAEKGENEYSKESNSGIDQSVSNYENGFVAVIGEGVASLSLASAIELECGIPAKVLCTTECPKDMLRECDVMTPDEEDVIAAAEGAAIIIADPLFKAVCSPEAKFISLPSEAFSGRLYRSEIPNLISDFEDFSKKIYIE